MLKVSTLTIKFEVSQSIISIIINMLIYDLNEVLAEIIPINLPTHWNKHKFEDVVGAIDCTSHYQCCVHPGQALYYHGNKHAHFITTQVICAMDGSKIYSVTLSLGHNNDSSMAILTGLKEGLLAANIKLLANGSYSKSYVMTSTDKANPQWCGEHVAQQSVIERVNSQTATFSTFCINTGKFQGPPELQTVALMCIYHFVQHRLQFAPLYTNRQGPAQFHWFHEDLGSSDSEGGEEDGDMTESSKSDESESDDVLMPPW